MSSSWAYGSLPSLALAQSDAVTKAFAASTWRGPSYTDHLVNLKQVLDALGWSGKLLPEITAGFLPSPTVLDALKLSIVTNNAVWQNQITQVLSSQQTLLGLAARKDFAPAFEAISDTLVRYGGVQTVLGSILADTDRRADLLRGYSTPPGIRYDTFLNRLPGRPSPRRVALAQHSGDVQSGLLVVESLTAPGLDEVEATELVEEFTDLLVEPWREAPTRMREALLVRLDMLDPEISELIRGGWEDVERAGPAAASKIAHCAAEVLSRTLRALAPSPEVIAWVGHHHPREKGLLSGQGQPTRAARVRYALRDRPRRDRRLAEAQIDALIKLFTDTNDVLQPAKHETSVTIMVAATHLQTVENAVALIISQVD